MERAWSGRVRPGSETEHERFLDWLSSAEGRALLARSLLTSYRLVEDEGRITITFGADEPPPIVRFLRNRRFWPEFWEFESAGSESGASPAAVERMAWRK